MIALAMENTFSVGTLEQEYDKEITGQRGQGWVHFIAIIINPIFSYYVGQLCGQYRSILWRKQILLSLPHVAKYPTVEMGPSA